MAISELFENDIKSHRVVLDTIRQHKEISGAQLSRLTDYRPSTLVYVLRTLQKKGLIEVSRIGKSTSAGGKPPRLWRLVANRGYIIGLDIVPHKIRTTIVDFASNIVYQDVERTPYTVDSPEVIPNLAAHIRQLIGRAQLNLDQIIGVGLAFPALVNTDTGTIYYSQALGIKNFPVCKLLSDALELPVEVVNDANAGALSMKWFPGHAQDKCTGCIVFFAVDESYTGLGTGLILDNELYHGAAGAAGEIVPYLPEIGKLIDEGVQEYGDGQFKLDIRDKRTVTMKEVVECAQQDCPLSHYLLERIGRFVAQTIVTIIGFFDPELVVIGGDSEVTRFFIDRYIGLYIEEGCRQYFSNNFQIPEITASEFGIYSVSIGATTPIMAKIFSY